MAAWHEIPVLGIGATYSGAIEPLIERHPELFDVLEIEPQTTWIRVADRELPFRVDRGVLDHLALLPGRKIIHSVGWPVGGTCTPEAGELELLNDTIQYLGAPWASNHLSFNQTSEFGTGFFLPPRQTLAGVQTASVSIRRLQEALMVPVSVETGVSYMRPRDDELPDGEFVARVVEMADCGLLLDLHNVYCNSVNGRQPLERFLDQIPLDRVYEVHLAGGFDLDSFYLDAHSGAIPVELHAVVQEIIPHLQNLKAIVFEIFPSFIPVVGLDLVKDQLEWLHAVWRRPAFPTNVRSAPVQPRSEALDLEGIGTYVSASVRPALVQPAPDSEEPDLVPPAMWEQALGRLVVGRSPNNEIGIELSDDPGVRIVERLIHEFRASMIVRVLPLTSRFIMLALGTEGFRTILADYWSRVTPQMYASLEASSFIRYLEAIDLRVPHLAKVAEFEDAVTTTNIDGSTRIVHFDFEPLPFLRAIAAGRLPEGAPQPGDFEIELTPDDPESAVGHPNLEAVRQTFPSH